MKKKITVLAVLVLCLTMLASGTLAYFTKDATATNVITTSGVDIVIEEWSDEEQKIPYVNPVEVMPGATVDKIVTVKNLQAPAYIRAKVVIGMEKDGVALDPEKDADKVVLDELKDIVSFTFGDKWTQSGDYWYYNSAVGTEKSTEPLFSSVSFSGPRMDNKYQNCKILINITADAVQSANNLIPANGTVADVGGWSNS